MELLSFDAVWAVLAIILIDLVLAGDNALVIGMAANRLPDHLKKKAIFWGTLGAIGIRFLSVAVLGYLLLIPGLKMIGGIALLYIGWKLAFQQGDHSIEAKDTFWGAISTIVIADAVMGIDNALGIAAAAGGNFWMVVFGLLVSVPVVLFGSSVIAKILERYPESVFMGSFVLFVVAAKMILAEPLLDTHLDPLHDFYETVLPWLVAILMTAKQYYRSRIHR